MQNVLLAKILLVVFTSVEERLNLKLAYGTSVPHSTKCNVTIC